jgi:hypothetical protein
MTMLKGNAARPASLNEFISPTPLLLLAPNEPPAPIANLSPAQRNALVACINAGGLYKQAGAWHGPFGGKPLSGITIANLARDGMLTVTTNHRLGSAKLTGRGNWFARTLLHDPETSNGESLRREARQRA